MKFNLNEFLLAVSWALDFVETDILGVSLNHSKRVAYISLKMAEEIGMRPEEIFDLVSLALLHDNSISEKAIHDTIQNRNVDILSSIESCRKHCIISEENLKNYPFLTNVEGVILYHHENYDGSGFFGKKEDSIPLMSQIISLADTLDLKFDLKNSYFKNRNEILSFVKANENKLFSSRLVNTFLKISENTGFWLDLKDEYIIRALKSNLPLFSKNLNLEKIHDITKVFSKIIDSKSKFTLKHSYGLSLKVSEMSDYYNKDREEKLKLIIAADLHDLGKLAIPNSILDKNGRLTEREFDIIKTHTYYTRIVLSEISGFEEITEWAANHHEKLDGSGYPFGKNDRQLDFNSRLMACLDIYQALTEERPYRKPIPHYKAIEILKQMAYDRAIDITIVDDIDKVFSK
ncbi:HD domain-containing protein [Caloranaerobacter azorensis DSM 13643]|uniref:HD domain-containing protein n=1 Tax=Caloranaerobacter azorensis DSM 13643 TaxID=1121264 RepID=A0A1M5T712_9FIRM|nr:HD domain-containing phosphohydrolase [Caloranaerobacter azorensis]SHH46535.1 HD domain-containing protein [Caloranaerobacter azorensis DSM 13643]